MKDTERDWLLDVAGELFKMMAGVNMVHVQYRGDAGGKANVRHLTVPNSRSGSGTAPPSLFPARRVHHDKRTRWPAACASESGQGTKPLAR
jgi:hypothetical protein